MELLCGILFSTDWSVVWVKKKSTHRKNSTDQIPQLRICGKAKYVKKNQCVENTPAIWQMCGKYARNLRVARKCIFVGAQVWNLFSTFFFCGKAKSMFFNWLLIEAAGWESVRLFFFPLNIWFIVNYSWRCRRKFWLQGNFNDLLFWFHQWRFHPISTEILNRSSLMLVLPWS